MSRVTPFLLFTKPTTHHEISDDLKASKLRLNTGDAGFTLRLNDFAVIIGNSRLHL